MGEIREIKREKDSDLIIIVRKKLDNFVRDFSCKRKMSSTVLKFDFENKF